MLLSNRKNFLFVHIAKTGGSSIRSALSRSRWQEPYYIPQMICNRISHITGHKLGVKLPRHAPVVTAQHMLKGPHFDGLFKFAFVRNPWDRLVSAYCHFQREQKSLLAEHRIRAMPDFTDWILGDNIDYCGEAGEFIRSIRRLQVDHLIDLDHNIVVNYIGRYERLSEDFRQLCERLDVPHVELPHKRNSKRSAGYREQYDAQSRDRVAAFYRRDIETLGYRFGEPESFRSMGEIENCKSITVKPSILSESSEMARAG
ncbi:MAG: sulfotransferase family 2 domain-containing protein [Planctomycetales bacterium]|nr:sulfotransferase family 2 domain-containing protein [Planctomycetales bacterium]